MHQLSSVFDRPPRRSAGHCRTTAGTGGEAGLTNAMSASLRRAGRRFQGSRARLTQLQQVANRGQRARQEHAAHGHRHGTLPSAVRAGAFPAERVLAVAGLLAVLGLAAALRFANFDASYLTPYYDAAVRSMSLSWHNSSTARSSRPARSRSTNAGGPVAAGRVGAAVRLLLDRPAPPAGHRRHAVGALLYDLVRRGFGRWAGLAAALALAVLPSAVLTSRSDTMDTVMATLLLAAAWVIVRVRPERRAVAVVAAGALAGLAFEVKLFEATVALPALALAGLAGARAAPSAHLRARRAGLPRRRVLVGRGVASLLQGQHPYPLGSTDGQIWNALLVYNGVHRLGRRADGRDHTRAHAPVRPVHPAAVRRADTEACVRGVGLGRTRAAQCAPAREPDHARGGRRPRRVADPRRAGDELHGPPVAATLEAFHSGRGRK